MSTIQGGGIMVTNGLVLYLDAANPISYIGTGTNWNNLSISGGSGTLLNGTTFSTNKAGTIVFDGINDCVDLGDNYGISGSSFSYGAWFYFNGNSQLGAIMGKRNDAPFNQYNLVIADNAQTGGNGRKVGAFAYDDQLTTATQFNHDLTNSGANWYHVTIVIGTTSQFMYVNGKSVLSANANYNNSTFIISGKKLYIGALNISNAPGIFFKSSFISNVFIYNRALTAQEVLQNYNALKLRFGL